jgi:hypothetical protein
VSNRRRRTERKAARVEAANAEKREAARSARRHIEAPLDYPGAGELLVRLACRPSFEPPVVWEVRSLDGILVAYRSSGDEPGLEFVVAHERISVDESSLRTALDRLSLLALPITPRLTDAAVTDGVSYVATIHAGFGTTCRHSWCDGTEPKAWSPVVEAFLQLRNLLQGGRESVPAGSSAQLFHVGSRTSSANLVRLDAGDFQVWDPGEFGSLLCGADHILATTALANALQGACGDDIEVRPAKIVRLSTGESWSSYMEIIPLAELAGPDDLPRARQSTRRAWHYAHSQLFVRAEVRDLLAALDLPDLVFSPGFRQFAGLRNY